jgi:hypothetical protein
MSDSDKSKGFDICSGKKIFAPITLFLFLQKVIALEIFKGESGVKPQSIQTELEKSTLKDAVKKISEKYKIKKNDVYEKALRIKNDSL